MDEISNPKRIQQGIEIQPKNVSITLDRFHVFKNVFMPTTNLCVNLQQRILPSSSDKSGAPFSTLFHLIFSGIKDRPVPQPRRSSSSSGARTTASSSRPTPRNRSSISLWFRLPLSSYGTAATMPVKRRTYWLLESGRENVNDEISVSKSS